MKRRSTRGFSIIEMALYMGVLVVILNLAFGVYQEYVNGSRHLQRNAADISAALLAGERWRADLREAVAPPYLNEQGSLVVPQARGEIVYAFSDSQVKRWSGPQSLVLLKGVNVSKMEKDVRQRVTAWSWELELATKRKDAAVRPLFTFKSVAPFRE